MRNTLLLIFSLTLVAISLASQLLGTTLPESYPLIEADLSKIPQDKNLEAWMDRHFLKEYPFDQSRELYKQDLIQMDPITAALTRLRFAIQEKDKATMALEVGVLSDLLKEQSKEHPLSGMAYFEILNSGVYEGEEAADIKAKVTQFGTATCAEKKMVHAELTMEDLSKKDPAELKMILDKTQSFRSTQYRKSSLKKFIEAIPVKHRKAMTDNIYSYAKEWKSVLHSTEWLKKIASGRKLKQLSQPHKGFHLAKEAVRKRRCSTAKNHFLKAIKETKNPSEELLETAVESAKGVDGCYRRRGAKARRGFWVKIEKPLEEIFGFKGWVEARLRIGYLYWTRDNFKKAKDSFHEVITASIEKEDKAGEAKAIFALARVAENEGKPVDAEAYYRDYALRFSDQVDYDKALMATVLLAIDRRDWEGAEKPLAQILDLHAKSDKDIDSTTTAFALFWSGRVYMEVKKPALAKERWRRLASEYYSSFYGAMGHFMLERLTGVKFALQPVRNPPFRMHVMRNLFEPADRLRIIRTEKLLQVGFKEEALCELAELDTNEQPDRLAIRSLLLSASGQWLDAIKTFSAIPRSYRNSLPIGFEKILFPVRYKTEVDEYSARAGIDGDLVRAIIRQESVFNPNARSPVGAIGLMQLMPATARLEARRLGKSYLPLSKRRKLRQRSKRKKNLYAPDTNIALGVHHVRHLLKLYGSPVLALSAYNASPRAARNWKKSIPSQDLMAFVERIPYRETRAYVKLVLRNYFYYKRWYSGAVPELAHIESVAQPIMSVASDVEGDVDKDN